jgi:hypothetical protein
MGESKARAENRSKTYPGIAAAIAQQWGTVPVKNTMQLSLNFQS